LEYLNSYLASTCFTLLNVNKDVFYKELHDAGNQKTLKNFASDKNQRALLIAKIEKGEIKPPSNEGMIPNKEEEMGTSQEKSSEFESEILSNWEEGDPAKVELKFSLKVVYMGQLAHTIAFLKRESYAMLDFKASEGGRHLSS